MKRKSKLFLSLASMMFAVALLCFGVYSAISVNYTLSGSVSYQVTDAFVEITTKVYASKDLMDEETLKTSAQAIEESTFGDIQTTYGEPVKEIPTFSSLTGGDTFTPKKDDEINIDYNQAYTYFIVVNVKNLSGDVNVYAQITNKIDEQNLNSNIYTTKVQEQIIKPQESENNGKNIIIAYSLKDPTQSISQTFSYTITVNSGEYIPVGPTLQFVSSENITSPEGEQQKFIVEDDQATCSLENVQGDYVTEMQGFSIYTKNITLENYQDYKGMTFSISLDSENIIMFVFKGNYTVDELMSMLSAVPSEEIILATMGSGRYTPSCEITDKICILASQQNIDLDITLTPTDYARFLTFTLIDNGTALSVEARDNSITGVDGKIEIPSEYMGMPVTTIGEYAFFDSTFFDCSSLSEITIPQSVTTIREGAFYNCSNLQSLDLRACTKLTTIGNYAFTDCSSLTKITIPQSVKTIGDYAFSSCRSLSEITIPESVTTIGDHAFDGCYSLVEVYNKSSQSIETTSYGLTALNVYSDTQGESKLKYYNANGEETQDGDYIFYIDGNTKYFIKYKGQDTEITLPTISSIGSYEIYKNALGYNEKITSVILSDSVTTIGDLAFYDCSSLSEITIPQSVTTIGNNAFNGCGSLNTVTIDNLDIANAIGVSTSQGNLLYYLKSGTGIVKVKCNSLSEIESTSYLKSSNFNQPIEIVDGYAVFTKK